MVPPAGEEGFPFAALRTSRDQVGGAVGVPDGHLTGAAKLRERPDRTVNMTELLNARYNGGRQKEQREFRASRGTKQQAVKGMVTKQRAPAASRAVALPCVCQTAL